MSEKSVLLVAGHERPEHDQLIELLESQRYGVFTARDSGQALRLLEKPFDLVITEPPSSADGGLDLLDRWRQRNPATPFMMLTSDGDIEHAVRAMKLGADDYYRLSSPVDREDLLRRVRDCLGLERPADGAPRADRPEASALSTMVGCSPDMLRVFEHIKRAAATAATIVITGESGTGKELVARAIHELSSRAEGPFISTNVSAIPETLIESELFGHVAGAFTGAGADRDGRFAAAAGGTLFIDEVAELRPACQAKLLRVLETRCITPVGSNEEQKVDVRLVAATHRHLERMTARGDFREDLYYRLKVITIALPPLRERRQDIPILVRHFLEQLGKRLGKRQLVVDDELLDFLQNYSWPGNVRQLRNCLESMAVLAREPRLTVDDLPPMVRRSANSHRLRVPCGYTLDQLRRKAVLQTLRDCRGNRVCTARKLQVSIRTLHRWLNRWKVKTDNEAIAGESA